MKLLCSRFLIVLFGLVSSKAIALPLKAQAIPDDTTNTVINSTDRGIDIEMGDRAGNNLFHSFQEFSVPNGSEAFFNNPSDIINIFSRVTGGNISNIDGLLKANGNANLFLINPAGIVFGEGAALDIGGSFITSTAESIIFPDDLEFSATDTDNQPLLTINQPLGLNFGNNSGDITINGSNLQVNSGETLALFGGNVTITGGQIIAPGANIELGGLAETGQISFTQSGNTVSFPEVIDRSDITFNNDAEINVQASGDGNINVNANHIELLNESNLRAGIASESDLTNAQAGDITLNATGDIVLNQASRIDNRVEESGMGNAGEIKINTTNLFLKQGGLITANTFGEGNAGIIVIDASGNISADGEGQSTQISSGIYSQVVGVGDASGIQITTTNLSLTNGGVIGASTFGIGDAGAINIEASGTISAEGEKQSGTPSGIFSTVGSSVAIGNSSGGIEITTTDIILRGGGQISGSTFGIGDAGAINIEASGTISGEGKSQAGGISGIYSTVGTSGEGNSGEISITTTKLSLSRGSRVNVATFGQGDGGNLTITASESIELRGLTDRFPSGLFASAVVGNGNAGNLTIATDRLIVEDRAVITVGNFEPSIEGVESNIEPLPAGTGAAGNLEINANSVEVGDGGKIAADNANGIGGNLTLNTDSLTLDNKASVSAFTTADRGQGGILTLNIDDTLLMSNNSSISARANRGANGGNVTIDAEFVIAFPNQNNDIIASATQGNGGEINIFTNSIFGIAENTSTPANNTNDIDASSEFGLDGTISINELEVNPAEGLGELPIETVDVTGLVAQNLCQQGKGSEFIVTGKGGVASSPLQTRDGEINEVDLVPPANNDREEITTSRGVLQYTLTNTEPEIIEAQGWIINDRGILELVVQKNYINNYPQPQNNRVCQKH